jgi:transcription antitermination factor NusG
MRSWIVVLALAACGPSASEIKTAQTATYNSTPDQLLNIAEEVAQENYKIGDVSRDGFVTAPRWFGPEGDVENAGAGDYVQVRDKSVRVSLHVKVIETAEHRVMVTVTPETIQFLQGSPQPRPLGPDDPYLPPFVKGRAEALTLAIYERAKTMVVK